MKKSNQQPTQSRAKAPFPYGYLLLGLLVGAIGVCFLALNNVFGILAIALGIIVIVFSLVIFAQALLDKKRGFIFVCKLTAAIAGIACGIVTLIVQDGAIYVISNIIYLMLIIDGAYKVGAAFHSHKYYLIRFWIIAILGGALVVCSFLMSKYEPDPADHSNMFHNMLTGILLLADGIVNLLYAFFRSSFHAVEEKPEQKRVAPTTKENASEPISSAKPENGITESSHEKPEKGETPPISTPVISVFDDDPFK